MPVSPGQGGDITLKRTGAHKITVTPPGGAAKTTGFTHGNLQITFTANQRQVMVAEYGSTPIDIEVTGVVATIKFSMIEKSLKTFDIAMNGIYPLNWSTATTTRGIGRSGIQTAVSRGAQILLHPLSLGSATTEDITIYNALLVPTGNIEYSDQGDQIFEVEGTCVVGTTYGTGTDGALLMSFGIPNVGA